MAFVTTQDGTQIFYKDWGPKTATAIVFSHGWPLCSDDWDAQMLYFLANGYRVIAHDRRGHGRSTQTDTGNDMDTYAADLTTLTDHLDLKGAIHIGHSTGGGEVARYVSRAKPGRVAKAVLVAAVPPIMVKSAANPGGTPIEVFDGFRAALAANRAQFFLDVPSGPFYGFNRPGANVSQGVIQNWWRQGMMGGAKAHYDCIKAFSETDQDRRPQEDRSAHPRDARRRRPGRADRRRRTAVGQAPQARAAEGLQGLPARHADHTRGRPQPGPAGVHPRLSGTGPAWMQVPIRRQPHRRPRGK